MVMVFTICITNAQNKKEQIENLTISLDSLNQVVIIERNDFNTQLNKLSSINDSVNLELNQVKEDNLILSQKLSGLLKKLDSLIIIKEQMENLTILLDSLNQVVINERNHLIHQLNRLGSINDSVKLELNQVKEDKLVLSQELSGLLKKVEAEKAVEDANSVYSESNWIRIRDLNFMKDLKGHWYIDFEASDMYDHGESEGGDGSFRISSDEIEWCHGEAGCTVGRITEIAYQPFSGQYRIKCIKTHYYAVLDETNELGESYFYFYHSKNTLVVVEQRGEDYDKDWQIVKKLEWNGIKKKDLTIYRKSRR